MARDEVVVTDDYEVETFTVTEADINRLMDRAFGRMPPRAEES